MPEKNDSASLEDLERRLKAAKAKHDVRQSPVRSSLSASRVSVELFAGVAVGIAIGYGLDRWLDTLPIFLIIFFFIGVAAGVMNIYRLVKSYDTELEKAKE